jgi:serine/threonine protein kinase
MIVFSCPNCGAALDAPNDKAGQGFACPRCARAMTVPHLPRVVASLPVTPLPPLRRESPLTDVPLPTADDDASTLAAERHATGGSHSAQVFPFLAAAQAPDEIGRLDNYRVLRLLGQGGMGMVFEAEDTVLQRKVALKVMRPDLAKMDAARHRFLREARAAAALHHENIVTIFQVSKDRDVPYLAMEFLSGESLETLLRRIGRVPVDEALRIGRETAEGLAAAHDCGMIHRDIKPANIWLKATPDSAHSGVRSRDSHGRVRIIDFGLVRVDEAGSPLTGSGAVLGTPAYMAPEQADGKPIDARSDLFSLGCVLYRMLTGEVPFKGRGMLSTLVAVENSRVVPPEERLPGVSPEISACVMQLLERSADQRPSSARHVAEKLRALEALERSTDQSSLSGVPRPAAADRPRRGHKGWLIAGSVLASALIWAVVLLVVWNARGNKGSLELRSDEPKARVIVERDGQVVAILDSQGSPRAELSPGDYRVRLEGDWPQLHLDSTQLVVMRGANRVVRVRKLDEPVRIFRIEPPDQGFYSKKTDYQGIPIKAHASVADEALIEARNRLRMMLEHAPRIIENLVTSGAELHIIGKDQQTSDLPENRHLKGKPFDGKLTVDQRTRGLGGLAASCGEENLLHLPGDRYAGRDICVHEFAHTIRSYGLSPLVRKRIERQYRDSLNRGLWKNSYAAKNDDEFFAELSMWYFGTEGDTSKMDPKPARGREGLQRYDPEAFELLDEIYSGRAVMERNVFIDLPLLPPEREKALRSQRSDVPTSIVFVNNTPGALDFYWLDFEGQRKFYFRLAPGTQSHQVTFATHPWVVVDGNQARGIFIGVSDPGRALVDGK